MNGKTLLITGAIAISALIAQPAAAATQLSEVTARTTHLRVADTAPAGIEVCGSPTPHSSAFDIDGYMVARKVALSRQRAARP